MYVLARDRLGAVSTKCEEGLLCLCWPHPVCRPWKLSEVVSLLAAPSVQAVKALW